MLIKRSPSPVTHRTLSFGLETAKPKAVGIAPPIAPPNRNVFGLSCVKYPISFAGPARPEIIKNLFVSPINFGNATFLSSKVLFSIINP